MKYKVIIVDDHKIFRDGFRLAIETMPNARLIGEAANGKEFLKLLEFKHPDIVFIDVNMPVMNGADTVENAIIKFPDIKYIALTSFDEIDSIRKMVHAGVVGYILKSTDIEEIEKAITNVMNGKNYFSSEVLVHFTKNTFDEVKKDKSRDEEISVSKREMEVLELICNGKAVSEISDKLNISERTVEKHKENLMLKSQTKNSINLVLWAIRNQIIKN